MSLGKLASCLLVLLAVLLGAAPASAQQKCEGPAQMCAEILKLQEPLAEQKRLTQKAEASDDTDVQRARIEEHKLDEKKTEERMAGMIALAASVAIGLKLLISMLTAWKGYFRSDRSKAFLKLCLVGVGFLAFVATNLGFGIPWWQALVLAGGGPGSILIHELGKMVPVLRGQRKYDEVDPDGDPTNPDLPPDGRG